MDEDRAFNEAVKAARETFKFFWREVSWEQRRIVPALNGAWVKIVFVDPSIGDPNLDTEFMWVAIHQFDGNMLTGELINQPKTLKNIQQGARVQRSLRDLVDWLYFCNGKAYGGHTVQHFRAHMSLAERKEHDAAWGVDFGDPSEVPFEAHRSDGTKGEERSFLQKMLRGSRPPAHQDHPMCLNCTEVFASQLGGNPALVHLKDEAGLSMLHREALAGNFALVQVLASLGANRSETTDSGATPADLAERMGWGEVAAFLRA